MLKITSLKPGVLIELNNIPYQVISASFNMLGRGHSMTKTKLKNLTTGAVIEMVFKGNDLLKEAEIERKKAQFLYQDKDRYFFMDNETYEQFSLPAFLLGMSKDFLKEGSEIEVLYHQNKPIDINLPIKMAFQVIETEPGIRGGRETPGTKKAKIETGATLAVPLFIQENDIILIDTRTGKYVERVKK
jgi:elongation factor P